MQIEDKVRGKSVGIYLRKERINENLIKNGFGRLKWLEVEIGSDKLVKGRYIDEVDETKRLDEVIEEIRKRNIKVLLIWSIEDIEINKLVELVQVCTNSRTNIISFCETDECIRRIKSCIRQYMRKRLIKYKKTS